MQRVLFVTPHLSFGGAERVLASLSAALGAKGHGVDILSVTRGGSADSFAAWIGPTGATLARIAPRQIAQALSQWPLEPVCALAFVGWTPAIRLAPMIAARRPGLRMVGFAFNPVEAVADLRHVSAHLAVTIAESLQVAAAFGPSARIAVVPSGLDAALVPLSPPRPENGRLNVGFIGRMDASKNVKGLILAANELPPDRFTFNLYGDGPLRRRARLRAWLTCPRHDIRFHGRVSDDALSSGFAALDVLAVPSLVDGRPLVISEAQLRGVAVVASRIGAIPDLVADGETGILCPAGDPKAFARALRVLAADPDKRAALAIQARQDALTREAHPARMARYLGAILGG